jgi:antitoxin component of MazEF toxin-antitoxin module
MLVQLGADNQITLPQSIVQAIGFNEYFGVEVLAGRNILTPLNRADAVWAKLAELGITEQDIADAIALVRRNKPLGQ